MKKSIVIIAILSFGFLLGNGLMTSCAGKKSGQQEQKDDEHHDKADSTATAYACPMHPDVTGKDGDKCSKCGMKLEAMKKKEDDQKH